MTIEHQNHRRKSSHMEMVTPIELQETDRTPDRQGLHIIYSKTQTPTTEGTENCRREGPCLTWKQANQDSIFQQKTLRLEDLGRFISSSERSHLPLTMTLSKLSY